MNCGLRIADCGFAEARRFRPFRIPPSPFRVPHSIHPTRTLLVCASAPTVKPPSDVSLLTPAATAVLRNRKLPSSNFRFFSSAAAGLRRLASSSALPCPSSVLSRLHGPFASFRGNSTRRPSLRYPRSSDRASSRRRRPFFSRRSPAHSAFRIPKYENLIPNQNRPRP
jgi:hypothetical protein